MASNTLHVDSQLMQHMLPADPIDFKHHLNAVRDEHHLPLVFSIGNDDHLWAIKADERGANRSINLSQVLAVRGKVDTFAVVQASDVDAKIYLAFAVTRPESKSSDLYVVDAFKPTDLNTPSESLPSKLIPGFQNEEVKVNALYLSPTTDSTDSYPFLVASYNKVLDLNKDANIARIVVESNKWEWYRDLRIPEKATTLNYVCGAQLNSMMKGILCLYTKDTHQSLVFSTIKVGDPSPFYIYLKVPAGANITSMVPYQDENDSTGFFLVGDGLWHLARSDIVAPDPSQTPSHEIHQVSRDPIFANSSNITIAQAGDAISIWFSNKEHTLGYQRARHDGSLDGDATALLPSGSTIDYTAILDPSSKSQSLLVVGDNNKLSVMEQAIETDMWNERPFLVTLPNAFVELPAFVSHVQLRDSANGPLAEKKINLASSGWVNLLINGEGHMVGSTPTVVTTDGKGVLTIIQPTNDVSGYKYTFSNVDDEPPIISPEGFVVDPSQKAQDALFTLTSVDALKKLGASGSNDELQQAADAIQKLQGITNNMPVGSTISSSAMKATITTDTHETFTDKLWGAWEWIKRKWNEVNEWIVDRVDGIWKFIVHIAGNVWHFILDSSAAVVKAVTWVLEKVKAGVNAVINYVSFLFNWEDIKETAKGVKNLVNSFLDYGIAAVDRKADMVENWIDGVEKTLRDALMLQLPNGLGDRKMTPDDADKAKPKDKETNTAESNTGVYHLEQGLKTSSTTGAVVSVFVNLYDDVLKPIMLNAEQGAKDLGDRLTQLFKDQKTLSVNDILKALAGELLHLVIGTIKSLVVGVMKLGRVILQGIKDILNSEIDVFGIFGGLFKKLGLALPSWLDVLSFVCAIPVNIFAKIITGSNPKRIQNFDCKAMIEEGKLDQQSALAYNELAGYLEITFAFISVVIKTIKVASAELPVELEAFSIVSLGGDLIMLAVAYPFDKESPGWDYRVAVWGVQVFNTLLKAILQKAKVPGSLKLLAAADILFAMASFGLVQGVHYFQLTEQFEDRDDAVTGLDISESVFDLAERLGTSIGVMSPPPVKLFSLAVIGVCGVGKAAVSTGKAGIATATNKVSYIKPMTL